MVDENIKPSEENQITRKEALKKIGDYGKYTALTALGTYMMLNAKSAQAASVMRTPPSPPKGFNF
jgi:hypothetical protein